MKPIPKAVVNAIRSLPLGQMEFFQHKGPRIYLAYRGRGKAYVNIFKSMDAYKRRQFPTHQIISLTMTNGDL